MLRIEVDVFSGRPNPVWLITDRGEAHGLQALMRDMPEARARPGAGFTGVGYREIRVTALGDDPDGPRVPRDLAVGTLAAKDPDASLDIARRLVEAMPKRSEVQLLEHELTPLDGRLRDFVLELLERFFRDPPRHFDPPRSPRGNPRITTVEDDRCSKCRYEVSQFNPGFWNRPEVQPRNNCYNYARNWRTDTFAQPGRAHGAKTNIMSCPTVTTAAMADGLVKRCDCLPDSEFPRRLMALVIAPDWDYHWYRHQRGGFWGHKPGQTAARNTDNDGNVITNPETCARGPYTDFCDYFYAGRSVVIN